MENVRLAKLFFAIGLLNALIALGATAPILFPQLQLAAGPGSSLTNNEAPWPASWAWIAYFTLLFAGVAGPWIWALAYYLLSSLFGRRESNKALGMLSLVLYEIGVIGATTLMAYVGLVGGRLVVEGVSTIVVTFAIQWAVVPIGALIGLTLLSVLLGIANIFISLRRPA